MGNYYRVDNRNRDNNSNRRNSTNSLDRQLEKLIRKHPELVLIIIAGVVLFWLFAIVYATIKEEKTSKNYSTTHPVQYQTQYEPVQGRTRYMGIEELGRETNRSAFNSTP